MDVLKIISVIKVSIDIEMAIFIKVHGKMTLRMDMVDFIYKMVKNIKESLFKDKSTVKEFIHGKMEIDMKGTLLMINDKV